MESSPNRILRALSRAATQPAPIAQADLGRQPPSVRTEETTRCMPVDEGVCGAVRVRQGREQCPQDKQNPLSHALESSSLSRIGLCPSLQSHRNSSLGSLRHPGLILSFLGFEPTTRQFVGYVARSAGLKPSGCWSGEPYLSRSPLGRPRQFGVTI